MNISIFLNIYGICCAENLHNASPLVLYRIGNNLLEQWGVPAVLQGTRTYSCNLQSLGDLSPPFPASADHHSDLMAMKLTYFGFYMSVRTHSICLFLSSSSFA